jgi:hypothetical protein
MRENSKSRNRVRTARRLKAEVISHYGGQACVCCGETGFLFLTIDHIDSKGAKHRKEAGLPVAGLYKWLKKNSFPPGFRVLCWNCNRGRHFNGGECPHKDPDGWERDLLRRFPILRRGRKPAERGRPSL